MACKSGSHMRQTPRSPDTHRRRRIQTFPTNQPTNLKTRLTIYRNVNNTTNVNNHKQTKTLASALFLFWNCKPDRNGPIQNPNTSPENKDQKRSIPINMNASDRGEVFHQFFSHTLLTLTYHSTRTTLRKLWNISS